MAEKILDREEYTALVDKLALALMDVLNREKPPVSAVVDSLTHVLTGAVGQLPLHLRESVREFVANSLLGIETGESGDLVDMSDQLQSAKH